MTKPFRLLKVVGKVIYLKLNVIFLIFIAKVLEPYLTLYQIDKSILPFLAADLYNFIESLMVENHSKIITL